ncbi:MAG: ABC transporter substrate-binding protein [Eubacteriales bacterium]|nr:ABC transporter substrate-binding protein [Eubacteriales bacterium]
MKNFKSIIAVVLTILLLLSLLAGCTELSKKSASDNTEVVEETTVVEEAKAEADKTDKGDKKSKEKSEDLIPEPIYGPEDYEISEELVYAGSEEIKYATEFRIDHFEGGYELITSKGIYRYLVVPADQVVPADLPEDVEVIQLGESRTYLAATAMIDMYRAVGALDEVKYCSLTEDRIHIDEAREAMAEGNLVFTGRSSAPDYEFLLADGCNLAVFNSNIYRNPQVRERFIDLGIPVFVEFSSYETKPLGRPEWVLAIGALTGRLEEAREAFAKASENFSDEPAEATGKRIAFFHISSDGSVNVRKSADIMVKLFHLAGAEYIFDDLGEPDDSTKTMTNVQMEEFYARAKDADILIYNAAIADELHSLQEFVNLSPHLKDLKAVSTGEVYCTYKRLYQESMGVAKLLEEIKAILSGESEGLHYIYKLK